MGKQGMQAEALTTEVRAKKVQRTQGASDD